MQREVRQRMRRMWQALGKQGREAVCAVEELIWPRGFQCLCCDKRSYGESLCSVCRKNLNELRERSGTGDLRSVWKYAGSAKQLVTRLKFGCNGDCAEVLASGMAEVIRQMQIPADAVLTWVTMPKKRRLDRGIDHGMELCRCISEQTGMEVRQLLVRNGRVKTQRGLNKEKRLTNLRRTFSCAEKIDGSVLLVDDVLTTGATVRACTEALLESGAERVYVVTATRTEMMGKAEKG